MSQSDPEFGLNGAQVRIFLGELRALDLDRAIEVWNAYAVAQERGYAASFEAAETIAAKQRTDAWLMARQAAARIARDRLGDPAVVGEVVEVLASVAGSIVIRDLLSRHDFKVLQLPWTWEGESTGLPLAAAAAAGVVTAPATKAPWLLGSSAAVPAAAGLAAVVVVAGALAFLGRPTSNIAVVEPTDAGQSTVPATTSAFGPSSFAPTTGPEPTSRPNSTGAPPPLPPTSAPQTQAPAPTPKPTPKPPRPTPQPTPTPHGKCEVVNLIDLNTVKAQEKWSAAGFTGTVTFSPDVPPQYRIVWQSLSAGTSVTCSSGVNVSDRAP